MVFYVARPVVRCACANVQIIIIIINISQASIDHIELLPSSRHHEQNIQAIMAGAISLRETIA